MWAPVFHCIYDLHFQIKQFIRLINSFFFQVIIKKLFRILIILKLELSLVLIKNKGGKDLQNLSWFFFLFKIMLFSFFYFYSSTHHSRNFISDQSPN
jgi:hypothetical protein